MRFGTLPPPSWVMIRSWRSLVLLVVVLAVTSGCRATIETRVEVNSSASANVSVAVMFTGEAGQVFDEHPAVAESFVAALDARGVVVERRDVNDGVRFVAELGVADPSTAPDQVVAGTVGPALVELSDVTGVAAMAIEPRAERVAVVKFALVEPAGVVAALSEAVAGLPDGPLLSATYRANTVVSVSVSFPGGVVDPGLFEVDGTTATYVVPVDELNDTAVSVSGSLEDPGRRWLLWVFAGAGVLLVAAGAVGRRR